MAAAAGPLGRALFAAIFLAAVPGHFTAASIGYATQAGVPMANILFRSSAWLRWWAGSPS